MTLLLRSLCLALLLPAAVRADRAAEAMAFLERWHASGVPGVSAAVAVKGEIVFSGGVGISDLESGSPQNGASVHNVGSISKLQAAVAIMQLWERKQVDLDAEIQTYLPWFPRKERPITLRQIMTHTTGIGRYIKGEYDNPYAGMAFRHYATFEESTRFWRDDPLLFAPGTHWYYSNAVNLIQGVVEAVSGLSYEEYLRRQVWEPAGMLSTQFDVPGRIVPHRGRGYWRNPATGQLENFPLEDLSYNYAAGGVISTDEDLCRFAIALNAGRLMRPETRAEMWRLQLPRDIVQTDRDIAMFKSRFPGGTLFRPGDAQALLWVVGRDALGRSYVGHTGGARGTSSWLVDYPKEEVVVVIHFNFDRSARSLERAESLAQLFLPPL